MMNDHDIEVHVHKLCNIITSKTAEFWEERNRAVLDLTAVLEAYPAARIHSAFTTDVLKLLVQPVKELVLDLRSQQVRDTCAFLTKLSEILQEDPAMKIFMRDVFDTVFLALKAPHKVICGYIDECILSLLRSTTFKSGVQTIASEVKESKSKHMRERSLDYLGEILIYWEVTERDLDGISDAITLGLEDASAKAREFARVAYMQLKTKYPRRAERLKAHLQVPIRAKLAKMEDEHDASERKKLMASGASQHDGGEEAEAVPAAAPPGLVSLQARVRGSITRQSMSAPGMPVGDAPAPHSAASSLFRKVATAEEHHTAYAAAVAPHVHKTIVPPTAAAVPAHSSHTHAAPSASTVSDVVPTVGMNVSVTVEGRQVHGVVRFFGETAFAPGEWVGIQLDTPDGKNDGTVKGHRYFTCPMFYGLFSRPSSLVISTAATPVDMARATSSMSDFGSTVVDTKPLCSILKVKLAKSLELLSLDMQLLERLEKPENFKISGEEYEKILTHLSESASEGANHLNTFKNDVERLNSF